MRSLFVVLSIFYMVFVLKNIYTLKCGKPAIAARNFKRVIRGKEALSNSFPWMVSLRYFNSRGVLSHFCGGSLIGMSYVLTAAHCVIQIDPEKIHLIIGLNNLNDTINEYNLFRPETIVYNKEFDMSNITYGADLALIKLDRPVTLSSKISFICLPPDDNETSIYNKTVIATGWGSTNGSNMPSVVANRLQQTSLKIVNGDDMCFSEGFVDEDYIYCAKSSEANPGSNICFGDSGGPIQYYINGTWYLYGVASFISDNNTGTTCNPWGAVYFIKVPVYYEWLQIALSKL